MLDRLQEALELVQTFHPVGVAARNLKECLLIQLDRLGKSESVEAAVVSQHLDDLGRKRYPEIAKSLSLTVEQVQQIANFISTLEPKPGRMFTTEQQQYVAPDVVIQKVTDKYVVLLNDEQIPHLRISNSYKELMASSEKSTEARDYIREKVRAGKFLIKSIHQRQQTIKNIAQVIVERQREFLDAGIAHLKPLTMAQVAEVVGVHETTVSRAVANKYMQTPQGLFEMKFFFTPGFETASGAAMSNTSVKENISKLIEREDPTKPLSDQEIVAILKEQGIPIARRTVAKYRNELNILPSNLRKTF
jgi:RNA polymerase sigma-54 factor